MAMTRATAAVAFLLPSLLVQGAQPDAFCSDAAATAASCAAASRETVLLQTRTSVGSMGVTGSRPAEVPDYMSGDAGSLMGELKAQRAADLRGKAAAAQPRRGAAANATSATNGTGKTNSTGKVNSTGGANSSRPANATRGINVTNGTAAPNATGGGRNGSRANATNVTNLTRANGTQVNGTNGTRVGNGTRGNGTHGNATSGAGVGHGANRTNATGLTNQTGVTNATGGNGTHATNGSNSTNTSTNGSAPVCITREDLRVKALGYATAKPGTPCVFGMDARDEGSHCILDDGQYGSLGWCFTSKSRAEWGSCGEGCPLFGQVGQLGKKMDDIEKEIKVIQHMVEESLEDGHKHGSGPRSGHKGPGPGR